jgi:hypothetical protein
LKKSISSGISPFAIMEAPRVREDEVEIAALYALGSLTTSSLIDGLVGRRLLLDSVAMEFKARVAQQVCE